MNQSSRKRPKKERLTRDSSGERFARLAAMGEQVFHIGDLANLWNIRNTSTLHMTLSRYVAQGLLHRIQNGLYSLKPPAEIHPYHLGVKAIHGPAYISCETVLFYAGVQSQPPRAIAIVSGASRQFSLAGNRYRSRKLSDAFLYNDAGIEIQDGTRIATLPRAVADMLYFHPKKHFDVPSVILWDKVRAVARAIGYPLKPYDTTAKK